MKRTVDACFAMLVIVAGCHRHPAPPRHETVARVSTHGRSSCIEEATAGPAPRPAVLRPVAPLSGTHVHTRRPELRWEAPPGAVSAVELCSDATCEHVIAHARGTGVGTPDTDLPSGDVHWRVVVGAGKSVPWTLHVRAGAHGAATGARGDLDGDGYADVVVGALGRDRHPAPFARIHRGGPNGLAVAHAELDGGVGEPYWWKPSQAAAFARGDFDGDGREDLAASLHDPLRVQVYLGLSERVVPARTVVVPNPTDREDEFATMVASADVDGDGFDDLVVGDENAQRVFVFRGSARGPATSPRETVATGEAWTNFGASVAGVGDLDGDGFEDVVVGDPGQGSVTAGRAWLLWGSASGLAWTARTVLTGMELPPELAELRGGSGRASSDFGFGRIAWPADRFFGDSPEAFVVGSSEQLRVYGRPSGGHPGTLSAGAMLGGGVFASGDLDGDGKPEVAITGSSGLDVECSVRRRRGGDSFDHPAKVHLGFRGIGSFGSALSIPGDIDGDGYADLVVTAPAVGGNVPLLLVFYGAPGEECVERTPRTVIFGVEWGDRARYGLWVR